MPTITNNWLLFGKKSPLGSLHIHTHTRDPNLSTQMGCKTNSKTRSSHLLRPLPQQEADTPRVSEPPRNPAAPAPPHHRCCNNTCAALFFSNCITVTKPSAMQSDNSMQAPVVAVEVLVDANFAGRVLVDLVMKILHRPADWRAPARTGQQRLWLEAASQQEQVKKFGDGYGLPLLPASKQEVLRGRFRLHLCSP